MSWSLAETIYVTVGVINLAGIFIWIFICLHMAYSKMDLILEHLKNCPAVTIRAPLRHGGVWGNLFLIGGISGLVTFPKYLIKKGLLDAEDLRSLPAPIVRKLAILQWSALVMLMIILVLAGVAKLDLV